MSGPKIGCGDSLVPMRAEIASGTAEAEISGALGSLFAIHDQYYGQSGLYNSLYQSNLTVESVSIDRGTATVRLTGSLTLGGVRDDPRAEAQVKHTVTQFSSVDDAMILLNGTLLFQAPGTQFFPETGHLAGGRFLEYWNQNGGLAVFGYPLTNEFQEKGQTVQYFERARFEAHPENQPPYDVLLGRLGVDVAEQSGLLSAAAFSPAAPHGACTYMPATGHNLRSGFRGYWNQFGGLAVYGYPISEEFQERNPDDGRIYTVQYFERQRFEWHPGEWPKRYDVMILGRVGAQILAAGGP